MKSWVYLVLIGFIAIAGYKFGYYHDKLAVSDEDKQRLLARFDDKPASALAVTDSRPALPTTQAAPAVLWQSTLVKRQNLLAAAKQQKADEAGQDPDSEARVKDFFTLHPNAQSLLLHSVRCTREGCELTGQYTGATDEFELMVEQLQGQPWWQYGTAMNSSSSEGDTTFFVLRFSPLVKS